MQIEAVMPVQDLHQRYFRTSIALSRMQVKNVISPLDIIKLLNANRISFVLVGAHGLAGWLRKPRATQDVDLVIAEKHLKKATRLLTTAYPQLEPVDFDVVIRLKDRDTDDVLIDLLKPRDLYRQTFRNTHELTEGKQIYRVPSLEMALAMKFAAMISPNRADEKKDQDAHDFIVMVKQHEELSEETLQQLGSLVYTEGGTEPLGMVRKVRAGERLIL